MDTNKELSKVIGYEENNRYCEYTEWYAFREQLFSKKMKEKFNNKIFKKFFFILHSAFYSSNNYDQFINLLSKFLAEQTYKQKNFQI